MHVTWPCCYILYWLHKHGPVWNSRKYGNPCIWKHWRKLWFVTYDLWPMTCDFWLVTFNLWPLTCDLWLVYSVLYSYIHSNLRDNFTYHQARVILSDHKIVRYWSCMIMAWIGQILLELWALESQRLLYLKGFTLYHLNFITSHHNIYCI